MVYVFLLLGLVLMVGGAEALVRGASRLAYSAGISPLVVGLTVVAFGTSSPELAVSILSAMEGQAGADIALGNVVGSNIFNVLFILGLSALIAPLAVAQKLVRIDVPIMIGVSVLVLIVGSDGSINRADGALLVAGIAAYTAFAIRQGRREAEAVAAEYDEAFGEHGRSRGSSANLLLVVGGLAALVVGSRWLVSGAVALADNFGMSELVIGVTIVAAGTSLPEVATSVVASLRGERDIAVGNVVGSNIFNILAVLGLSAVAGPDGVSVSDAALSFDIPVMVACAVVCLPIFFTGYRIGRLEALLFLGYYAAYLTYVILSTRSQNEVQLLGDALFYAVLPATGLILAIGVVRQLRGTVS